MQAKRGSQILCSYSYRQLLDAQFECWKLTLVLWETAPSTLNIKPQYASP